jgi:hypothetical protein
MLLPKSRKPIRSVNFPVWLWAIQDKKGPFRFLIICWSRTSLITFIFELQFRLKSFVFEFFDGGQNRCQSTYRVRVGCIFIYNLVPCVLRFSTSILFVSLFSNLHFSYCLFHGHCPPRINI